MRQRYLTFYIKLVPLIIIAVNSQTLTVHMISKFFKHIGYALQGFKWGFEREQHIRYHSLAALVAVILGLFARLNRFEWIAIVLCIGAVFCAEFLNSAIEKLADYVQPEYNMDIKRVKDLAAAAVLVVALSAFVVAVFIFYPHFVR